MSRCEFTLYLWPQGFCILIPVHNWPIAISPEFFLPFSLATDCPVSKQVLYLPKFYPAPENQPLLPCSDFDFIILGGNFSPWISGQCFFLRPQLSDGFKKVVDLLIIWYFCLFLL